MTPREAIELIKGQGHDEAVLWRDPEGRYYLLSEPDQDARYQAEGYLRQCTIGDMRKQFEEITGAGVRWGSELWRLMEDMNRPAE